MNDQQLSNPPLNKKLLELEAQFNSGRGDRDGLHRQLNEIRPSMNAEPNPVLRAEYLRRLALLDGTSVPQARAAG